MGTLRPSMQPRLEYHEFVLRCKLRIAIEIVLLTSVYLLGSPRPLARKPPRIKMHTPDEFPHCSGQDPEHSTTAGYFDKFMKTFIMCT
eukprot:5485340-Amphidinium_carterae.1